MPIPLLAAVIGIGTTLVLGSAIRRPAEQQLNKLIPLQLLGPGEAIGAKYRGLIDNKFFKDELKKHGFSDKRADLLFKVGEQLLALNDLAQLRRRGELDVTQYVEKAAQIHITAQNAEDFFKITERRIDANQILLALRREFVGEDVARKELKDQAWTDDRIDTLFKLTEFVASPVDTITWMGKEVFEPDVIKRFGMDDEFEELYPQGKPFFDKVGVTKEMALNFWRAHWVHPSFVQIREMLFRLPPDQVEARKETFIKQGLDPSKLPLEKKDLDDWFRLIEIPPFWRDRMTAIAFRPFTRRDILRMRRVGVLTPDEVERAYRDIGYDPEKAAKLRDFVEAYLDDPEEAEQTEGNRKREELRGLTRGAIMKQYKNEALTREEARGFLIGIGLGDEVTDFYLAQIDLDKEDEVVEENVRILKRLYLNGVIELAEVQNQMGKLNLPATQQEKLLNFWELERISRPSNPSKSELIAFLKNKIIDIKVFMTEMSNLGYSDRYIGWYLQGAGEKT